LIRHIQEHPAVARDDEREQLAERERGTIRQRTLARADDRLTRAPVDDQGDAQHPQTHR